MQLNILLFLVFGVSYIFGGSCSVSDCNLLSTCNACERFGDNCVWCQYDSSSDVRFCSTASQCSNPVTYQCNTDPAGELCADLDCQTCGEQADCAWCALPFKPNVGYCSSRVDCLGLWKYNMSCMTSTTTPTPPGGPRSGPTPPPPAVSRCGNFTTCGRCVKEYMCSWCGVEGEDGFCVDESAPDERLQCGLRSGAMSKTCTCKGWDICTDCRNNGCMWCGNKMNEYCFDLQVTGEFAKCISTNPKGNFDFYCTTFNWNSPYQGIDQDGNPNPTVASDSNSDKKGSSHTTLLAVVITAVLFVFCLIFGMVGIIVYKQHTRSLDL